MSILAEAARHDETFLTLMIVVVVAFSGVIAGIVWLAQWRTQTDMHHSGDVNVHHDGTIRHEVSGSVQHQVIHGGTVRHVHAISPEDRHRLDALARSQAQPVEQPRIIPVDARRAAVVEPPAWPSDPAVIHTIADRRELT